MQVGTKRMDLSTGANRPFFRAFHGAGIDRIEESFVAALGEREEDAAPGCVDVEEEGGVGGGCGRSGRGVSREEEG